MSEGKVAKLVLPGNDVIQITDNELMLGRKDIIRSVPAKKAKLVSRSHCRIFKVDERYYIQDGDGTKPSVNGTVVNRRRLLKNENKLLKNNDEIILGHAIKLKFKLE